MILLGIPKWQTIDLKNLTADCVVTFLTGSTSGHFVNLSTATYKYSKPPTARGKGIKGSSGELELAGVSAWNGTGTLHTWLLVQLHHGERWARRNLARTPCRQGLLTLCGSHTCLHVSLRTAPVCPPEEFTSISRRSVSFGIGHHPKTGTCWTDGLLSLPLPVPQGAPLFEGNDWCDVPMPEPRARQQGLKAHLWP